MGAITNFIAGKLASYLWSEYCQKIGLTKKPHYQQSLNELINDVNDLKRKMNIALADLDYIKTLEQQIYITMEKNAYKADLDLLQDIESSEDIKWTQFVTAVGNKSLKQLATDQTALSSLQLLLNDTYLNTLTNYSQSLSGPTSPFERLMLSMRDYLNVLIPTQGNASRDLVQLFEQNNETLMYFYAKALWSMQCIYLIQTTALYLKYHTKQFRDITLAEKGILNADDFMANSASLEYDYQRKFDALAKLVKVQVISDGASDVESAIHYKGVAKGDWVKYSVLYIWSGVAESKAGGYKGYYDGMKLTARASYNKVTRESTLDLSDAYEPASDCPVLTFTSSPYLACQFLSSRKFSFAEPSNSIGGYCDSYGGEYMHAISLGEGLVVYGKENVIGRNDLLGIAEYFLNSSDSKVYINQFIQYNFSNNERALFQFTRSSADLLSVSAGVGDFPWFNCSNTGTIPDAAGGDWVGGGNSEMFLVAPSCEEFIQISVNGIQHEEGGNYRQPTLNAIKVNRFELFFLCRLLTKSPAEIKVALKEQDITLSMTT